MRRTVGISLVCGFVATVGPAEAQSRDTVEVTLSVSAEGPVVELSEYRTSKVITRCRDECTVDVAPGDYVVSVSATDTTASGTKDVAIKRPGRIVITPQSEAGRSLALTAGIVGAATTVTGTWLFLHNWCIDTCVKDRSEGQQWLGAALAIGGGIMTAIGWARFGATSRPDVQITPAAVAMPGGALAGASVTF